MRLSSLLFALVTTVGGLAAQSQSLAPARVGLQLAFAAEGLQASVSFDEPKFLGAAILSLQPDLVYYFAELPPLLGNFVVMGIGQATEGKLTMSIPPFVPVVPFYGQGVVLTDHVYASHVVAIDGEN